MNRALIFLKRHSSTILSGLAAAGTIATAVFAVKETPRAVELLWDAEAEKGEKLTTTETVVVAAPAYLPAIGFGLATIGCIFGANILNQNQQASLVSSYVLLEQSYKKYREKVKTLFGPEADHIVRKAIRADELSEDGPISWDEKRTFYDEYGERFFDRTEKEIFLAEYHFNRNFAMRGYASLNEFYDFLGLEHTDKGSQVGWSLEAGGAFYGYQWVDFEHQVCRDKIGDGDEMEYTTILMPFPPSYDYLDPDEENTGREAEK